MSSQLEIVPLRLNERDVHVWYAWTDRLTGLELLETYHSLLSAEEHAANQRFVFAGHRHQDLISRALVRTVLSRYAAVDPRSWRFQKNAYGRPEIDPSLAAPRLRFNLSHTNGLAACAVTLNRDIGVDVEEVRRGTSLMESADRVLSSQEAATLQSLCGETKAGAFIDYWTLKEAYVKARGIGLSIPFSAFSFDIQDDEPARISFSDAIQDDPAAWQFVRHRPSEQYRLALAVARPADGELTISVQETVPG